MFTIGVASQTNCEETGNRTRFVFQTSEGDANPIFTITPVLDTVSDMRACRVCLAMGVKMYHMSEYNLSVMFEKVIGVEINEEDKLPQMLCWECVARLSSANNFVEKAFKTQWILLNKIHSCEYITASDINSIHETHTQLKSPLSVKFFKANESHLYINEEETEKQKKVKVEFVDRNSPIKTVNIKNEYNDVEDDDSNRKIFGTNDYDILISDEFNIKSEQIDEELDGFVNTFKENDETESIVNYDEFVIRDSANQEVVDSKRENNAIEVEGERDEEYSKISNVRKRVSGKKEKRLTSLNNTRSDAEDEEDLDSDHNTQDASTDLSTSSIMNNILFVDNNLEDTKTDIKVEKQKVNSDICFTHNVSGNVKSLFICNICDKPFDDRARLKQHMSKHSELHYCSSCGFKTSNKFILNAHLDSKHAKKIAFNCEHCSYKTHNKKYLIAHIVASHTTRTNTKHFSDSVTFSCPFCAFKTFVKKSLTIHINAKHTRHMPYNCFYCNFKTYHRKNLTSHVNAKHTKDDSYICSFCSFKTYSRQCLDTHFKVKHTQPISYNCSLCSFKSSRKHNLVAHVNSKHTKHISYKCTMCSYMSYQKKYLTQHIKVRHTRNTTYKCSLCSYSTHQKNCLVNHVNAKHTRNIYNCGWCGFKTYHNGVLSRHIRNIHRTQRERINPPNSPITTDDHQEYSRMRLEGLSSA